MRTFLRRLKSLLPSYQRRQDREMQQELAALKEFASPGELGNLTRAAEEARAVTCFPFIQGIGADLRYAWRSLKRDRVFALIAFISLSIGIGANVAVFGLTNALLWRQLPIRQPDQLVSFENTSRSYFGFSEFAKYSAAALQSVIAQSPVFEVPVDQGSGPAHRQAEFVSGGYFRTLGVASEAGRLIEPFDDQLRHPAQVAVLSFSYWRRAFHQDPAAVGRYIHIENAKFLIIGIAPEGFFGLSVGDTPDLWLPLTAYAAVFPGTNWLAGKNTNWLDIFGRLRSGMTIRRAQEILTPVSVDIDIQRNQIFPSRSQRKAMLQDSIRLIPASKGISELRSRFSQPLHIVFAMLGFGLLLACINVVSLQIARSDQGRKEFAIRLAIGAGRFRVARQCFTEMLLLSFVSKFLALLLFKPITNAVVSLMSVWGGVPAHLNIKLDGFTFAFVLLICVGVALICGLLPAIHATRQNLQSGLQLGSLSIAGQRSRRPLMRTVGIIQMAVSLILITATCLFAVSLEQLKHFDSGVQRNGLLTVTIDPSAAGYDDKRAVLLDRNLRDRFAAIAGVERVTYSQNGIYTPGRNSESDFKLDGDSSPSSHKHGIYDYVGPNFFTTLGTAILAGRDFTDRDTAAAPSVVIINQTLADRFFKNRNPIGQNFYQNPKKPYQIVGVVRDVKSNMHRRHSRLAWYLPEQQHDTHPFSTCFLIRATANKNALITRIKAAVHAENPNLMIDAVQTANELFDRTIETDRLLSRLGWAFGILAVLLASVGIYGLLSYDVARRTSEIGIRMALGAQRSDVAKLLLSQTALIVACGIGLGGVAANVLSRSLRNLIFGLNAGDPRVEFAAALILIVVAFAAAWMPIRRATRLDPMHALRTE